MRTIHIMQACAPFLDYSFSCSAIDKHLLSTAMTPSEVVASFERHIDCELRLGLSTMAAAAEKNMPSIIARLRALRPSMDQVTEFLERMSREESVFSIEQRRELASVAQATMVDPMAATPRATSKTQCNLFLHHYLPERLWGVLESEDKRENKFRQLAQFMCQLGLRNPDAQTKRFSMSFQHHNNMMLTSVL